MVDQNEAAVMAHILVVDDDSGISAMLADFLGLKGHTVELAADAVELDARLALGAAQPEVFLLDVGLPGRDGFALARSLRERLDPAILMLTGRGELIDRVVGLEIGADDYLEKPVDLAELAARIEAVLRRRGTTQDADRLPFGPYWFHLRAFALRDAAGRTIELSPMEVDLVAAFATHPGEVLDRETLLRLAPPRGSDSFDRSIDHRITRLRRKLEAVPDRPQLIKTVRSVGYVFTG
jgi:DNA-binding response OmpR family regulator